MNIISISAEAFLTDIFCWHWSELPYSILKHIANIVDYKKVPERIICDNEKVRKVVNWNKIEKMQMIRILVRCIDNEVNIMDDVDLVKYDYKIKDLSHLLRRKPSYIEDFKIDLKKITTSEAAVLLSLGDIYFIDKIDFSKYTFNFKESMNIIQGYNYDRSIIKKVNYKSLKGYQVADVLIKTGELNLDIMDIGKLTNIDWINLLTFRPDMLKYCDYKKFTSGDIFYSIKLCCMFDDIDLSNLIIERGVDEISPFGWEKLLIEKPEIFLYYCDFSKLDDNNWNNIIKNRPELQKYKSS